MGIEGGVLGSGAVSTVATLGVGLIIAIIVDYVIDAVFKACGYDPVEKIAGQVLGSIDKMEAALTADPDLFSSLVLSKKPGALRQKMQQIHEARSGLRRQTIAEFLTERK
jgi:hypothetical protein